MIGRFFLSLYVGRRTEYLLFFDIAKYKSSLITCEVEVASLLTKRVTIVGVALRMDVVAQDGGGRRDSFISWHGA